MSTDGIVVIWKDGTAQVLLREEAQKAFDVFMAIASAAMARGHTSTAASVSHAAIEGFNSFVRMSQEAKE